MRVRRGGILIEAIAALAIVVLAGVAYLAQASESQAAVRRAIVRDSALTDASRFLGIVTLWEREDLDRRLGDRRQGPWTLRIHRVTPRLYSIALLDSTASEEILRTAVLRPEQPR